MDTSMSVSSIAAVLLVLRWNTCVFFLLFEHMSETQPRNITFLQLPFHLNVLL